MAKRASLLAILPDRHFGEECSPEAALAQECASLAIEHLRPDWTVILGDWLDAAGFSAHRPTSISDSRRRGFIESEIEPCVEALDRIQDSSRKLSYIAGNHEHRVERWAIENVPGMVISEAFRAIDPANLLAKTAAGKKRKHWEYVRYTGTLPHLKLTPNLIACHGWSHSRRASEEHLRAAKSVSVIHGHTHRRQEVSTRNPITGETLFGMSPGCLSHLQPEYRRGPSESSHGFALVYVSRRDPSDWTHYLVAINNGRCILPDGTEIRAR